MPFKAFSPAEMIVTERRRMERPLMVLIWMSVCAFGLASGEPFYVMAGTLAAGINFAAIWRAREVYVARLIVNIGVVVATIIFVMELIFSHQSESTSVAHYVILILMCKLFERKSNRDYVQMLCLSLLVMISTTLHSNQPWLAVVAVIFSVVLCYTGMIFTLKRGLDQSAQAVLASETGPMAPQQVAWNVIRDWPKRSLRRKMWIILAIMLNMAVLAFLFLPRIPAITDPVLMAQAGGQQEVGFSREVSLGNPSSLYTSDRVMLRVHFQDKLPKTLPDGFGYLRAFAYEEYRQNTWIAASGDARPRNYERIALAGNVPAAPKDRTLVTEVAMEPTLAPSLFVENPAVAVDVPGLPCQVDENMNWSIPGQKPTGTKWIRYSVTTWLPPLSSPELRCLNNQDGYHAANQWPQDVAATVEATQTVKELARQWCADLLEQRKANPLKRDEYDLKIAQRIASRLKSPPYTYSLDFSDADPSADGVEDFLFRMQHGHCEYFASAMTVLCRTLGVRARLCGGFMFDHENFKDGQFIVRSRDAHAWTEVYTASTGWIVIDATSSTARTPTRKTGIWARLKDWWASARSQWDDRVLGYDETSYKQFLHKIGGFFGSIWGGIKTWIGAVGTAFFNLLMYGDVDKALMQFSFLLVGLAVVGEGVLIYRGVRRKKRLAGVAISPQQMEFFGMLQAVLERYGHERHHGQTFREQTAAAAKALAIPADDLAYLVSLYYRVRWGHRQATSQELSIAKWKVKHLEGQIRVRTQSI